jgi:hypothetical protein
MAGAVRQPIDVQALERYISKNVPEIQIPLDVKQVCLPSLCPLHLVLTLAEVWLWTIEPDIPTDSKEWPKIRHAEEASRKAPIEDSA